jgi:hypothetical protein
MSLAHGKRLIGVAILVAMAVAGGAAATWSSSNATSAAPAGNGWPAMTLIYQIEVKDRGLDAPASTQRWRVTYGGERQWRKELLDHSAAPGEVGTTYRFDGTTYTVYSPVVGQIVYTGQYPDVPMMPEQWLVPGRDRALEGKGYGKQVDTNGQYIRYTKTETIRCDADNPGPGNDQKANGITQPAGCATSPVYQATETIVYRADPTVPVEITTRLDGQIVKHVVVTELITR